MLLVTQFAEEEIERPLRRRVDGHFIERRYLAKRVGNKNALPKTASHWFTLNHGEPLVKRIIALLSQAGALVVLAVAVARTR